MPDFGIPARGHRAGVITHVRMDDAPEDDRRIVLSFSSEDPCLRHCDFGPAWEFLGHADY